MERQQAELEQQPADAGDRRFKDLGVEFAQLAREKRKINIRLKEIDSRTDLISESLMEAYQQMGMQRMTVDGVTIYIEETFWAGGAKIVSEETGEEYIDRQLTARALVDAGYADFVRPDFNVNTLSGWLRELDRDERGMPILPDSLVGKINVTHLFKLKTRISG